MAGWSYWLEKKVYIILKNKKVYSGIIIDIEESSEPKVVYITIIDKFQKKVLFLSSEIEMIKEEE